MAITREAQRNEQRTRSGNVLQWADPLSLPAAVVLRSVLGDRSALQITVPLGLVAGSGVVAALSGDIRRAAGLCPILLPGPRDPWGGGVPVNVTIYFTKNSAISPGKAEEDATGFYIIGPRETKALLVPRSAVALVYFSDQASDSVLLPESK